MHIIFVTHHLILTFEVEFVFLVAVVIVANYTQCGKFFAKSYNLKVHKQNVHEIEEISTKSHAYESINDIMESSIFKDTYLLKMSIKDLKNI